MTQQPPKGFSPATPAVGVSQLGRGEMLISLQAAGKKRDPGTVITQGFGEESCGHKGGLDSKGRTPNLFTHCLW